MNLSVPPAEDSLENTPGNRGQVWHNASSNLLIFKDPTENWDHSVFYKNFYGVGNQGDHIDLWNKLYATKEINTFLGAIFPSFASCDKAKEVWFWEIIK